MENKNKKLNTELVLNAYRAGLFPMAENSNTSEIFWVDPEVRGIIPLDKFHISRSLKKLLRKKPYSIKFNYNFEQVIQACAEQSEQRNETWINQTIIAAYSELFNQKCAHTVECWVDGALAGGLYGLTIGGAFFGESMFSKRPNASKIALVYLVDRLFERDFVLLDTQFLTQHLKNFGAIEIKREKYIKLLTSAVSLDRSFHGREPFDEESGLSRILQSNTQTS